MLYIIRQGDPTTTGGTVIEGHGLLTVENKRATRDGMMATGPVCDQGQGPIKEVIERKEMLFQYGDIGLR